MTQSALLTPSPVENSVATPSLFTAVTVRDVEIRNRLWVSPMCQYSVEEQDGVPTDWHLVHLGSFARGGAGLVMTEATAVVPEGRISAWDTGIWTDEQRDAWKPIVDFIHTQGAVAAIQLAHAGRKASTYRSWSGEGTHAIADGGWQTVAPSAAAFGDLAEPAELTAEQILETVRAFGDAAVRSFDAGFDVLEIHAAHGYLAHQFLSPLSNHRTDEYGGSLENRARFLLEIVREVRHRVGVEAPVLVRFSGTDWVEDSSWTVEEAATVAGWAHEVGADWFDMSSGGNHPSAAIPVGPGYQVEFASRVRQSTGVPTNAVGLITTAEQANSIIESGQADAVMIGREFLRDPHFGLRAAHQLGVQLDYWPAQYERAAWRRDS